jgi:ParB family chromosome partitioning protein
MMRLLDLPDTVLDMLRENLLATGHARALLGLEREEDMVLLAERIVQTEMTVREVERAVKAMNDAANAPDNVAEEVAETAESKLRRVHMRDLERRILEKMGRKAKITNSPKKRVIELTYDSDEDLEDLLRALCGNDFFAEE